MTQGWEPGQGRPVGSAGTMTTSAQPVRYAERLALVDLLDRVLAGGVVVAGDVTLSIAGVDLVRISLRALVASVAAMTDAPAGAVEPAG